LGDQIKEDEMGGVCSSRGAVGKRVRIHWKTWRKRLLGIPRYRLEEHSAYPGMQ